MVFIFYDNKLAGTAREVIDFSASLQYINLTVSQTVMTRYISTRSTEIRTYTLVILTPDTTNPLTDKNSDVDSSGPII